MIADAGLLRQNTRSPSPSHRGRMNTPNPAADPTPPVNRANECGSTLDHLGDPSLALSFGAPTPNDKPTIELAGASGSSFPTIPGYQVKAVLGRGGMGIVYLAEQTGLGRDVALKMVLDSRFASEHAKARFLAEAESLAKVRHPNIVQVHECGQWEGHPFFSLELVDGGSLDRFILGRPQEPRATAAFVAKIADGMQAAHDQGIIHRDLKPANVLLASSPRSGSGDASGAAADSDRLARLRGTAQALARGSISNLEDATPKITDFGLAKNLGAGLGLTASGEVLGTPNYMAPEQASGERQVTPATDVYALGAILYEMLTGRPPYTGDDVLQILLKVISSSATPPRELQPGLPRDLETICLKCLARVPSERYPSAAALAEDLRRFLDHRTIQARPATRRERVVKWCRRYPTAAALILVSTLAAVVGTTLAFWANTARAEAIAERNAKEQQRRLADQARSDAELRRAEAQAVLTFVQQRIFAAARTVDAEGGLGREVQLKEAIRAALPSLERDFSEQPLIEAQLRAMVGEAFFDLGELDVASAMIERAVELFMKELGADDPATLSAQTVLAACRAGLGKHAEARDLFEDILRRRLALQGPQHSQTLQAMQNLASVFGSLGDLPKELELLQEVKRRRLATLGPRHEETLAAVQAKAVCLTKMGRLTEALELHQETLRLRREILGPRHADTLVSMINLAHCYARLRRTVEACALEEEALPILEERLGPDHPRTLNTMNNLSLSYAELDRAEDSLKMGQEVLRRRQKKLGAYHPDTLASMHNVAVALFDLGRFAEALKINEETLKLRQQHMGHDHPETLVTMTNLAYCLTGLQRHRDALKVYEEVLVLLKARHGEDHPELADTLIGIANSYEALGQHEAALQNYEKSWQMRRTRFGPIHSETLSSRWGIIESLIALERQEEALPLIEETLKEAAQALARGQALLPPLVPRLFELRLTLCRKKGDAARCLAAAQEWEALGLPDAGSLFSAACFRAVAAELLAKSETSDAAQKAKEQADLAMDWLIRATAAGFNDKRKIEANPYLASLRRRDDFQKLLETLPEAGEFPTPNGQPPLRD